MRSRFSFLNVKGILTLLIFLAGVDVGTAFGAAPWLTRFVQSQINKRSTVKMSVGSIRFHPVLLSFGISSVEVYDAERGMRIFRAGHAAVRLSPLALLRKKLGFSRIVLDRIEAEAVKDDSGRFNFETAAQPAGGEDKLAFFKRMLGRGKMDWYGKLYEKLKWILRMNEERKKGKKAPKETNVEDFRKGRIVRFDSEWDTVFEVGRFELKDGTLVVSDGGQALPPFRKVNVLVKRLKVYRSKKAGFDFLEARGKFEAEKKGSFHLRVDHKQKAALVDAHLRNFNLGVFRALYENSLPVSFERGFLTLESKSRMDNESLVSENHLKVEDYALVSKSKLSLFGGAAEPVVAALNRRPSFELRFKIGGTPDQPSFSGFHEALMEIVQSDLQGALSSGGWKEKIKSWF